jgi:guanylate kinase
MEMVTESNIALKENLTRHGPAIIAISGPSGSGKDYLTGRAIEYFQSVGIPSVNVQMTTERPHRGEVETKICVSPDEYKRLQEEGMLIGDHLNRVRYGYNKSELAKAFEEAKREHGIVILELNPFTQTRFNDELKEEMGLELTAWIGVETTEKQTEENMRERGETDEAIAGRLALIHKYNEAMEANEEITLVDNGPTNRAESHMDFAEIISSSILARK